MTHHIEIGRSAGMPQPPNEDTTPSVNGELLSLEQQLHASLDRIEAQNSVEIQRCKTLLAALRDRSLVVEVRAPDFRICSENRAA